MFLKCRPLVSTSILTLLSSFISVSAEAQPKSVNFSSMVPFTAAHSTPYCMAIQGNGDAIFGHFHSMARMVEQYGPAEGAAGSSSASISMFLYESMLVNPAILEVRHDPKEVSLRLSLLLKSLVGFYQQHVNSKESVALQNYSVLYKLLEPEAIKAALGDPSLTGLLTLRAKLQEIMSSDNGNLARDLGIVYNRRFGELFLQSPDLYYHVKDFYDSISTGPWKIDTPKIFVRPFPIDFNGVATIVGWIGNFYASRGYDESSWKSWVKSCGPLQQYKGKSWGEIAYEGYTHENRAEFTATNFQGAKLTTCGAGFQNLVASYDANPQLDNENIVQRMDEPVGFYFRTLPITGLLVGVGAKKMEHAIEQHWAAVRDIQLNIDYDKELRIGFFGRDSDLDAVARSVQHGLQDGSLVNIKAQKFTPLSGYTWRMVMNTSPAEPSIAEAKVMIPHQIVSIGGWVDPQPATLLKHAGCQNIVFLTGELESTDFIQSLNNLVGGQEFNERLTARQPVPGFGPSALMDGLSDAGAVWCTEWHKHRGVALKDVYDMTETSYRAPFEVRSEFFQTSAYPWSPLLNRASCTPGY